MVQPSQNHRDPWFPPFFQEILEDCKMIFGTKEGTPFIYPGTGTGGWEVALANTLSPGDKIVTFRYGQFSHLWVDMMQRLGLDVSTTLSRSFSVLCVKTLAERMAARAAPVMSVHHVHVLLMVVTCHTLSQGTDWRPCIEPTPSAVGVSRASLYYAQMG